MNEEQEDIQQEAPKTLSGLRARLQEKFVDIAKAAKDKSEHDDSDGEEKKPFFKGGDDDGDDRDGDEGEKKKKPPFFKKKNGNGDDDDDGDEEKEKDDKGSKGGRSIDIHIRGEGGKKKGVKEEMEMDEETTAAASLHPGARPAKDSKAITPSRVESLKNVVTFAAGLNKQDLSKWFKQSQDCYGPGKHFGVPKDGGYNQGTIDTTLGKGPKTKDPMPKLNVKEDLEELFAGQELSEEFMERTATLFEAAVHARLVLESARLEEEFVEILTEEITHFTSTMTNKLDSYLDYVVENWMAENQVATETSLRNELTGEFIDGLKNLFAEHYIDVPEERIDVLEALAEKVDNLENRLEEKVTECDTLKEAVIGAAKQEVFAEMATGLTMQQQDKFATLAEGIEFDGDFDHYAQKLTVVKEQYFTNKAPSHSNILEEQYEGDDTQTTNHYVDPSVNRYAAAIARTVKQNGVVGS